MEKVWKVLGKYRIGLLIVTLILGKQIWKSGNFVNPKLLQTQRTYRILQVLLPVLSLASPNFSEDLNNISDIQRIDTFVTEQIKRHRVPGLALAVVDGDQVVFMKGYGKADQTGRPITPQKPFILASVSKPITAVAIMQLVDAGKIELDAPIQQYLPEFRLADPAASSQITVRHLLLHTSGHIAGFRGGSFRAWILKIVTNSAYDTLRRLKRHPTQPLYGEDQYGDEIEAPVWLTDPASSVQNIVEQGELSRNLQRLIDELPLVYRTVLTLVDLHQLDYAEVAHTLQIPIGTVKSRLARARLQMSLKLRSMENRQFCLYFQT